MTGWKTSTLGSLCKFENGDRGKNYPGRKAFVPSGIPFINAGHLDDGEIDWKGMDFILRDRFDILGNGKVQKRDLLFCLRGSLGKFGVVDQDIEGAIASSLVIVRPGEILDCDFLAAYFRSTLCAEMISKYANGAAQPNLSANSLKEFRIPHPPLPEQKRIVAILDEAFAAIDAAVANTEKNLANARELFESYLNGVFTRKGDGWVEKTIANVADVVSGHSFKSGDFSEDNDIKSIKITNVGVREFVSESYNYLPSDFVATYKKFQVKEGSIVIALTRSIISTGLKVAIVPSGYNGSLLNQRVAALKVDSDIILRQFLYSYLCTQSVVDFVKKQANTLMQPNLSITDLKNLLVPVPPIAEQLKMVEKIDSLSNQTQRLESIYQQKLTALAELKQSILQKAFAGELTPQPETTVAEAVA